jgi:hypothetical protein
MRKATEEPVISAAMRLTMTRERVIRRIQTGELAGRRDPDVGWVVDKASVDSYRATRSGAVAIAS